MRIYAAAVAAVAPRRVMARAWAAAATGTEEVPAIVARARGVRLLAVGKAALGMAAEAELRLGDRIIEGLAIAPVGTMDPSSNATAAISPRSLRHIRCPTNPLPWRRAPRSRWRRGLSPANS